MYLALQLLKGSNLSNQAVVIFTDSKTTIQSISQHNAKLVMINETQKYVHILRSSGNLITAQWVPVHVDVEGNKRTNILVIERRKKYITIEIAELYDLYTIITQKFKCRIHYSYNHKQFTNYQFNQETRMQP